MLFAPGNSDAVFLCPDTYEASKIKEIADFNTKHVNSGKLLSKVHFALNRESYDCPTVSRGPCADDDMQWFQRCANYAQTAAISYHTSWSYRW